MILMSFIYSYVCRGMSYCCFNAIIYNFQQRISWLSHRWRTQRNAISNVNCRIQWIIESLNAPCAPWYSEEHACLSVIKFSTSPICFEWGLDLERAGPFLGRLLFKCISGVFFDLRYRRDNHVTPLTDVSVRLQWSSDDLSKFDLKSGRTTRWT